MLSGATVRKVEPSKGRRFANRSDLFRIESVWGGLEGLQGLPRNCRTWIPFLTALLKVGFTGIRAPIGALVDAHYRASPGANASQRSAYRALTVLEEHGYIKRYTCRLGEDSKRSLISINPDRFAFFLRKKESPKKLAGVRKHAETYYSDSHMPEWQVYEVSNNSQFLTSKERFQKQVKAKSMPKNCGSKKQLDKGRKHPVLYSCECVLYADRVDRSTMEGILALMQSEIDGKARSALTDWAYWPGRWRDISNQSRENLARREILPAYLSRFKGRALAPTSSHQTSSQLPVDGPPGLDVGALVSAVMGSTEADTLPATPKETKPQSVEGQEMLLNGDEIAILSAARDRAKRRELS